MEHFAQKLVLVSLILLLSQCSFGGVSIDVKNHTGQTINRLFIYTNTDTIEVSKFESNSTKNIKLSSPGGTGVSYAVDNDTPKKLNVYFEDGYRGTMELKLVTDSTHIFTQNLKLGY